MKRHRWLWWVVGAVVAWYVWRTWLGSPVALSDLTDKALTLAAPVRDVVRR